MTAVVPATNERKSSALERSLVELCRNQEWSAPEWLQAPRRQAMEWLESNGLQTSRDDAWKNTPVSGLLDQTLTSSASQGTARAIASHAEFVAASSGPVLWIVNGVAMTDAPPVRGVRWLSLPEAARSDERVRSRLATLVRVENGFTATNQAAFTDGWCIVVDPGVVLDEPIEIRFIESADNGPALSLPRLFVLVGASSRVRLIERHLSNSSNTALSAGVVEVFVEDGAKLEHSRLLDHGPQTWALLTTAVNVGNEAEYRGWSATARGRYVRNDLAVDLAGHRATAILDGLHYARRGCLAAQLVRVWHQRPEGTTKECYRGIVENQGRGVFDGIIYVGKDASRTDARQESRNLLLGPEAIANTKPHLEIDNDDVTCSHGATVGQLDEQQLFYLRARGIAEDEAKAVLTWAFAKEIVDRCPSPELRQSAAAVLESSATAGAQPRVEVAT